MADPDWDVAGLLQTLMQNDPNDFGDVTGVTTIPDSRIIKPVDDGKGVDWTREYILIRETGERAKGWRYLTMSAYDADAIATIETATPTSRARREEIWGEIETILTNNRKRSLGLSGNWGWIDFDGIAIDDDAFNFWGLEVVVAFHKRAEPV